MFQAAISGNVWLGVETLGNNDNNFNNTLNDTLDYSVSYTVSTS